MRARNAAVCVLVLLLAAAGCTREAEYCYPNPDGAILWAEPYPTLELQPVAPTGYQPQPEAIAALVSMLANVTEKEVVVEPPLATPARGSDHVWTFAELEALKKLWGNHPGTAPPWGQPYRLVVFFLDGRLGPEHGPAGLAGPGWAAYAFVFPDAIPRINATLAGQVDPRLWRAAYERAIAVHEVGHVLGLVNMTLPMVTPHADADHPFHSANPASVMYWVVGSPSSMPPDLSRWPDFSFDADDLRDLAAFRQLGFESLCGWLLDEADQSKPADAATARP